MPPWDMKTAMWNSTPNSTARIFVPIDKIDIGDLLYSLLDKMSIWKGIDVQADEYYSWEFDFKNIEFVINTVNVLNENN